VTTSNLSDSKHLEVSLALSSAEAIARLANRVAPEGPLGFAVGDRSGDYVGVFEGARFRIRRATPIARPYAVQAYGSVHDRNGGSVVIVTLRRSHVMTALVWVMRILTLVLMAGALLAAIRQPVFLAFGVFVALGGGALLWDARERTRDRQDLRRLIRQTLAET
jgi:hypothetical protein